LTLSSPSKLLIATTNPGKKRELTSLLKTFAPRIRLLTPDLSLFPQPSLEAGRSYRANALQKAKFYAISYPDILILSEDSGLEVDILGKKPGIRSARFAPTPQEANEKVLQLLKGVPFHQRTARYVCVMVLRFPGGKIQTGRGICEGFIAEEPKGKFGFGYDPIFFYPPFGKTFGEVPLRLKNRVSHRSLALRTLLSFLTD